MDGVLKAYKRPLRKAMPRTVGQYSESFCQERQLVGKGAARDLPGANSASYQLVVYGKSSQRLNGKLNKKLFLLLAKKDKAKPHLPTAKRNICTTQQSYSFMGTRVRGVLARAAKIQPAFLENHSSHF